MLKLKRILRTTAWLVTVVSGASFAIMLMRVVTAIDDALRHGDPSWVPLHPTMHRPQAPMGAGVPTLIRPEQREVTDDGQRIR